MNLYDGPHLVYSQMQPQVGCFYVQAGGARMLPQQSLGPPACLRASSCLLNCTNNLATDTSANELSTVAQQQQNRKVDMRFIQDPESVLRTDGCYCTQPRAELTRRLQHGEITGPATKCQLYVPKTPIFPAQIREIFQRSPANRVVQMLQRTLYEQASQLAAKQLLHLRQYEPL